MELTTIQIAQALGITNRGVVRRSNKESWSFVTLNNRGDRRYPLDSLPRDVQAAVIRAQAAEQAGMSSAFQPGGRMSPLAMLVAANKKTAPAPSCANTILSPPLQRQALTKFQIIQRYEDALGRWGSKEKNRRRFMEGYNTGIAFPDLFEILGPLSWQTIERWKRQLRETRDCFTLADNRGRWRKGEVSLTEDQRKILLRCALNPNKPLISEVVRTALSVMHACGILDGHHESTYRRYLEWWRDHNYHVWTFTREGEKAWNDKCAVDIERDLTLINVGDVIIADGHTLNFEIVNPWTGKPARMNLIVWFDMRSNYPLGWEIDPTENTQSIASALRRAIIALGKTPQIAYLDNGKAFASRFFNGQDLNPYQGVFAKLDIRTVFAWPYHAQSKTVERFFGTFAELERLCPTYTGTSIETKPPRLMRGEKLHRRLYDRLTGGRCLTMEEAHRAIAAWFDDYARRPQRGHLEGETPFEVFEAGRGPGVDADEIRWLMMGVAVRTIRKSQIALFGRTYYAPELYGRKHEVTVRYDLCDPSQVYIFEGDTYICTAPEKGKCHPSATHLGTDQDKTTLTGWIETKQSQKKEATGLAREMLEAEVIPETRRRLAAIGFGEDHPEASRPGKVIALPEPEDLDEEALYKEVERRKAESAAAQVKLIWRQVEQANEVKRYELLIEVAAQGILIPRQWQQWMTYFEQTSGYKMDEGHWSQLRAEAAVRYQAETNKKEMTNEA